QAVDATACGDVRGGPGPGGRGRSGGDRPRPRASAGVHHARRGPLRRLKTRMVYSAAVTLFELADRLGCRLEGDGTLEVTRVAGIEDAGSGAVTFLANSKYVGKLATTRATAVIVGESATGAPCAVLR